jgi:hypothetical protein
MSGRIGIRSRRMPDGGIGGRMRGYTAKEKAKITAGAVAAVIIVGWLVVLAIVLLSVR